MKFIGLLLFSAMLTGTLHAEFRIWTRNDGKTADLELIGKKGEGDSLEASFKMRNGLKVSFPVSDLSDADAEIVKSWEPQPVATAQVGGAESVYDEYLEGDLVKLDGKSLKSYKLDKKPTKYYMFYYTASWCPPCQAFTPSLVKFYDKYKAESDEFEIILVTSDSDKGAMEDYAKSKHMNWPHIKFSKTDNFKKEFKHPGSGIPNLVLTDLQGKLIKTSYEGKNYLGPHVVMEHLETLIKK